MKMRMKHPGIGIHGDFQTADTTAVTVFNKINAGHLGTAFKVPHEERKFFIHFIEQRQKLFRRTVRNGNNHMHNHIFFTEAIEDRTKLGLPLQRQHGLAVKTKLIAAEVDALYILDELHAIVIDIPKLTTTVHRFTFIEKSKVIGIMIEILIKLGDLVVVRNMLFEVFKIAFIYQVFR